MGFGMDEYEDSCDEEVAERLDYLDSERRSKQDSIKNLVYKEVKKQLAQRRVSHVAHVLVDRLPLARGDRVERTCKCGQVFNPRLVDIRRGWGKSCSKSCAAKRKAKRL